MTITLEQITGGQAHAVRAFAGIQTRTGKDEATGARTVTGIGVPYGAEFSTSWFRERFEPGAIEDDSEALAFYEHRHAIGRVSASRELPEGREVELTLSRTSTADEAYTLAQDNVIRGMSIAFQPIEWREEHSDDDERPLIVHTRVAVKEYSLVAFPAYSDARVASVRSAPQHSTPKEHHDMSTAPAPDLSEMVTRSELDAATAALGARLDDAARSAAEAPQIDADTLQHRAAAWDSLGDWVQAVASDRSERHDEAVTLYRDVTTSDVPSKLVNTPGFIGDLTKRITERRRWTSRFRTRALPAKGMSVDYIKTETIATVAEQKKELDALAKGAGFSVTSAKSPVRTFGGAETVSRQVVDRSEPWALTALFEAFAMQYGKETETATKAYIIEQIDAILADESEGSTIAVPAEFGAFDWIDGIVDSAGIFEDRGYTLEELAVSPDIFKRLAAEAGTDGRPLLTVSGAGVNVVGSLNLPAASGELMRVPVTVLHGSEGRALFYDSAAIETLETPGAPFWLQDDNVLNLSRDFACYGYMAHITPHPGALLPVKFGA